MECYIFGKCKQNNNRSTMSLRIFGHTVVLSVTPQSAFKMDNTTGLETLLELSVRTLMGGAHHAKFYT